MIEGGSLWAAVMDRYRHEQELRVGPLGGRFHVQFAEGVLIIRKSTGVAKRIDFDEFRAGWRTLANDAGADAMERVTGNGPYLEAIRADLVSSGVPADLETDLGGDEVNSGEAVLLQAAEGEPSSDVEKPSRARSGPRKKPESKTKDGVTVDLQAVLDSEREAMAEVRRENVRLTAELSVLEERLGQETARADGLERLAAEAQQQSNARIATIGAKQDVVGDLLHAAETILSASSAPDDLRRSMKFAIEFARRDPAAATAKARVVTEILVRREWARVMGGDSSSSRKHFHDYARELEGHPDVNASTLAVKRTIYRVANPAAHTLDISPRLAALVVVVLASIVDAEMTNT